MEEGALIRMLDMLVHRLGSVEAQNEVAIARIAQLEQDLELLTVPGCGTYVDGLNNLPFIVKKDDARSMTAVQVNFIFAAEELSWWRHPFQMYKSQPGQYKDVLPAGVLLESALAEGTLCSDLQIPSSQCLVSEHIGEVVIKREFACVQAVSSPSRCNLSLLLRFKQALPFRTVCEQAAAIADFAGISKGRIHQMEVVSIPGPLVALRKLFFYDAALRDADLLRVRVADAVSQMTPPLRSFASKWLNEPAVAALFDIRDVHLLHAIL